MKNSEGLSRIWKMKGMQVNNFSSIDILSSSTCPIKDTSRDDQSANGIFMTDSMLSVVDFDMVKNKYIKDLSLHEMPKSVDALYTDTDGNMYLIEFKNGTLDMKKQYSVQWKIFDSLLILSDIINERISFTRQNLNFILVYNYEKNPADAPDADCPQESQSRVNIGEYVYSKRGKRRFIRFSLERFEGLYFKNVFTVTKEQFENSFIQTWTN